MTKERLFLNNVECDLSADTVIALTFQINDIAELKDRQANYSNTFKLPQTVTNRTIFEDAERVASLSRIPYIKIPAEYIKNGITIIHNGFAVLERSNNFYNVTVYSGNLSFFDLLGENKISDLDFSDLDHTWDEPTIIANWAATNPSANQGFVYALIDYGGMSTTGADYNIDRLLPSVFVQTILDKVFARYGFNYDGSFTESEQFKKLIVPCTGGTLQHDAAWVTDKLFQASMAGIQSITTHNNTKLIITNDSTGGNFDNGNHYDEINSDYVVEESMYANFILDAETFAAFHSQHEINFVVNGIFTLAGTIPSGGSGTLTGSYSSGWMNFKKGDTISWWTKNLNPVVINISNTTAFQTNTKCSVQIANKLLFNSSLQIGSIMPDMKQFDFIKGIMQMYCLMVQTDIASKTISFNFFDDIPKNKPIAKDWTDKLHMDKSTQELSYRNSTYGQKNWLRYAEYSNIIDEIEEGVPIGFGDGYFEINDTTLEEEKEILTLPFAASINKKIATWDVNITEIKRGADTGFDKSVKPRICYLEMLKVNIITYVNTVISNSYSFGVDFASAPYGRFKQISCVPAAAHPTDDENDFRLGYDDSLIADHYTGIKNVLAEYKMMTALFKLNESDMFELNQMIPVFLKQFAAYFYINNISNFKGNLLTKTQIIKLSASGASEFPASIPVPDAEFIVDGDIFIGFFMQAPNGNDIVIDWGDGNIETVTATGSLEEYDHTYADANKYLIKLTGPGITDLNISSDLIDDQLIRIIRLPSTLINLVTYGNVPLTSINAIFNCINLEIIDCELCGITFLDTAANPNVREIYVHDNQIDSVNFSVNVKVEIITCYLNQITSINVTGCVLLNTLRTGDNQITSIDISDCNLLTELQLEQNELPVSEVNNILVTIDGFGLSNGLLALENQTPPAPPTGAGATAKANLIGKGWSCTTD